MRAFRPRRQQNSTSHRCDHANPRNVSQVRYLAIMRECANTVIGVWSESVLDRTVVVAVYPTWLELVHTAGADFDERVAEIVR